MVPRADGKPTHIAKLGARGPVVVSLSRVESDAVCDHDLEQRRERSWLSLDARRDERLPAVREHDDVTGLDVRRRVLEEPEERSSPATHHGGPLRNQRGPSQGLVSFVSDCPPTRAVLAS